tara:strand:- start:198 stop:1211 length:1014 start_codon:yes stop_codon:yes gene_type:complete
MLRFLLRYLNHLIFYYYLRLVNSLIVRIPENIILYPIGLSIEVIRYFLTLPNYSIKYLAKPLSNSIYFPNNAINHGIVKSNINSEWFIDSNDPEIAYHPRRLFWLVYELTESRTKDPSNLICYTNKFIFDFSKSISIEKFPPYVLSECISNLSLFNRSINRSWVFLNQSQESFVLSAHKLLLMHLEFRGPFSTCNHILNNFRALYLSSQALGIHDDKRFFLRFWKHVKSELFCSSNILREGSIHYHFLITSWLFEICICAYEVNDKFILDAVNPYLISHLDLISWFSDKKSIPLFGDLSPDCPLEWLLPLSSYSNMKDPFASIGSVSKGWDLLWNYE